MTRRQHRLRVIVRPLVGIDAGLPVELAELVAQQRQVVLQGRVYAAALVDPEKSGTSGTSGTLQGAPR